MIFKVVTLLIILLFVSSRTKNGVVASLTREEFQVLNKSDLVKTIQLEDGDIVDCLDFHKQPAFSHPLLKDHKIQMLPQSYLTRREKQLQALRFKEKACPSGTVPNRRNTKELAMASSLSRQGISPSNLILDHHLVYVNLERSEHITYHGASGVVSVYNLSVNLDNEEMSKSNIWVENGPVGIGVLNFIVVGSEVGASNDINPRLFTHWSVDEGKTGCHNQQCGFVQVDPHIAPGHLLSPVSTFGGPTYGLKLKIFQDQKTGNWLLSITDEDIVVGYFPKELFPYLKDGAKHVAWGGATYTGTNQNSPPMGSGHKPDGKYNHAAYFRNLTYFDQNFVHRPSSDTRLFHYVDASGCYGFKKGSQKGEYWGYNFFFGGPGGPYCEE